MATEIIIRTVEPNEYALLSELAYRSKAYWGYSDEFMEACRGELATSIKDIEDRHRNYFVAEFNGEVLGYYATEKLTESQYELEHLFVEPEHIGQGVGKALIEHAKSFVKSIGGKSLLIQGDPNAVNFYLAAGGVQIGQRESDSISGRYLPEFKIYI